MPIATFTSYVVHSTEDCIENKLLRKLFKLDNALYKDLISELTSGRVTSDHQSQASKISFINWTANWNNWLLTARKKHKEIFNFLLEVKVFPENLNKEFLIFDKATVRLLVLALEECARTVKGLIYVSRTNKRVKYSTKELAIILQGKEHLIKVVTNFISDVKFSARPGIYYIRTDPFC